MINTSTTGATPTIGATPTGLLMLVARRRERGPDHSNSRGEQRPGA